MALGITGRPRWPAALSALSTVGASAAIALWSPGTAAQVAPDAGSLLRQFQQNTPAPGPAPLAPPPAIPEAPLPQSTGATVLVRGFHIVSKVVPEAVLQDVVKEYIGRDLTLGDLESAALKISDYYRNLNLLARAYVPPQTVKNGIVEIVVLEGRLGEVLVDPSSDARLDPAMAAGIVKARVPAGEELYISSIGEGVQVLNEVPGTAATASLAPGAEPGETNVVLKTTNTPIVTGQIEADNEGLRATGEHRAMPYFSVNNPLGFGEQATGMGLFSSSSRYGRVTLAAPVGYSGLTFGVAASTLSYELGAPFAALGQSGIAYTVGPTAAYPILRGPTLSLTASANFDHKRFINTALGTTLSDKEADVAVTRLNGTLTDDLIGGGLNTFGIGVSFGNLDLSRNAVNLAADHVTARSNGTYAKLLWNASRAQKIDEDLEFYLGVYGQLAANNLDSSEQIALGGPAGVRAYPSNEAAGDTGALWTAELRYKPVTDVRVFAFYDGGWILQHTTTWPGWQPVPGQPNSYVLQGIGVGTAWAPIEAVLARAMVSHPLGDNPGHTATGSDSDGRHEQVRVFAELSVRF